MRLSATTRPADARPCGNQHHPRRSAPDTRPKAPRGGHLAMIPGYRDPMTTPTLPALPTVIEGSRLPILSWATDAEETAFAQARNLANLEVARHHIALMPDAHSGFGMPIGGVLLTEAAVVPYAIGVDIGCGVQIAQTNLVWGDNFDPEKLRNVLRQ